jgi:hypothetical protein
MKTPLQFTIKNTCRKLQLGVAKTWKKEASNLFFANKSALIGLSEAILYNGRSILKV